MRHAGIVMQELISRAQTVHAYSESNASKAMGLMLEAVIESYKLALIEATATDLPYIQGAIKQAIAIHGVVTGATLNPPQI